MTILTEEDRIKLLQDNLKTLRQLGGWLTLDGFAEQLGVTKQSISRFENKKVTITRPMYIAIRAILEQKCAEEKNSKSSYKILTRAIPILLREDGYENISDTEYANIKKTLETIAAASSGNADKGILSNILSSAASAIPSLGPIALGSLAIGAATLAGPAIPAIINNAFLFPWLTRLLKDNKEKNKANKLKDKD